MLSVRLREGYLTDLQAPEAWPTMADVGATYTARTDISTRETKKCAKTWKEFTRTTAAATLHDLSPEIIARWGQKLRQSGLGPKSIKHAIGRVRTILHYYLTTGKGLEHVRRAIDACRVLRSPEALCKDPKPISRAHFNALLKVAQGEERAMLLVALNLALYAVDIAALEWSAFDMTAGTFTQRRGKTKVPRVGCLWPATTPSP